MKMQTLSDARSLMRWIAMGIQPSQANASAAREIVRDAHFSGCGVDLSGVMKDLGFCAMGVLPGRERVLESLAPLDRAVIELEGGGSFRDRPRA